MRYKDQLFSLELEMIGLTRKEASKILTNILCNENQIRKFDSTFLNIPVQDKYIINDKDDRFWMIEDDISIQTLMISVDDVILHEENSHKRVELITPKLSYEDIPMLKKIVKAFEEYGAIINRSCAVHVRVDGSNHNIKSLINLLNIFYNTQDLIYEIIGVYSSREKNYCKKINSNLIEKINFRNVKNIKELEELWYSLNFAKYSDPNTDRTCVKDESRLHGLNLHDYWYRGAIEFRMFNGTLDFDIINSYIDFCLALSAQAINKSPNKVKEFTDNLNKTLMPFAISDKNNRVNVSKLEVVTNLLKSINMTKKSINTFIKKPEIKITENYLRRNQISLSF